MATITTQKALRATFRATFKNELDFKKIPDYSGKGKMYKTDTRCAFTEWVDSMHRDGFICEQLANRATL